MSLASIYRDIPPFKGKRRLGSLLFKKAIAASRDMHVHGKYGCQYVLPNLQEALALDIFLDGIYEPLTHEFLLGIIPKNAVILDIGANIGSISIPILKKRKDLRCISVEASPFVFSYLKKNISLNGLESQVTLINKALTNNDGDVLPFYTDPANFGKGSLSALFTDKPVMVETITVDTLLKQLNVYKIDFIKADIEGYEFFAFSGAEQLLQSPDAPAIFFEFVDWAEQNAQLRPGAAQQLFLEKGYQLFMMRGKNELKKMDTALHKDSAMIYATKSNANAASGS